MSDADHFLALGKFTPDKIGLRPYAATKTGQQFPNALPQTSIKVLKSNSFFTSKSVVLFNGDSVDINQWVLARLGDGATARVFRVEEIVNEIGSPKTRCSIADAVLLRFCTLGEYVQPLRMPRVKLLDEFLLLPVAVRDQSLH